MKRTVAAFFCGIFLMTLLSFSIQNETGWLSGHFKASVDLGNGDQPLFLHAHEGEDIKTVLDQANGIGCTDLWDVSPATPDAVFLVKKSDAGCNPATKVKLVNTGEGIMTAYFYSPDQDGAFASAVFNRYAD